MINVELLKKTLAHIEAHPEQWNQRDWRDVDHDLRCGTACCFAGWAALLNGSTWDVPDSEIENYDWDHDPNGDKLADVDGGRAVSRVATRALGLTWTQADQLFAGGNDIEDLRAIVAELCEQAEDVTP